MDADFILVMLLSFAFSQSGAVQLFNVELMNFALSNWSNFGSLRFRLELSHLTGVNILHCIFNL